jgi:HSP20 family molecular chaperone IbpA
VGAPAGYRFVAFFFVAFLAVDRPAAFFVVARPLVFMNSLRDELGVNLMPVDAGMRFGVGSLGEVRPIRAARLTLRNEPKPGHDTRSPPLAAACTVSKYAPSTRSADRLSTSAFDATASTSSDLFKTPPPPERRPTLGLRYRNAPVRVGQAFATIWCGAEWGNPIRRRSGMSQQHGDAAAAGEPQSVPVNMYEAERALVLVAPLPGVMVDDIEVVIDGRRATISAAMRSSAPKDYLLHEWHYGPYERVVDLPDGFGGPAEATFANGQLALRIERGPTGATQTVAVVSKP